jgi:CRISPR-associated protein Cas6
MFWQDEENDVERFVVPENVIDVLFSISCKTLPVDHAHALSTAVKDVLPWFENEEQAGLHLIHVAESGNGWERPQGEDELLYPSRRTKLILRVPQHRLEDIKALIGQKLDVAGNEMEIGKSAVRLLSTSTTLYARYVAVKAAEQSEDVFIAELVEELKGAGIRFKKVLCGKENTFNTPEGPMITRSVMVADLPLEDTVRLQENGIGSPRHKKIGCGLFIAHKAV